MDTYVLYHAVCYDGFSAAWAAWKVFGDEAVYLPVSYGNPFPAQVPVGAVVFILDFSYPRADLREHWSQSASLVVLDHHKTAQAELAGLDFATFDMDKSGAVLAWEYFHKGKPLPPLLAYVQDRDLWRWELPRSREVSAALHAYEFDFATWDQLAGMDMDALATEGEAIERFKTKQVKMICDQATMGDIGGHYVPLVNATAFWSEVGEELLARYPDAPMVGSWFLRSDGQQQWSLRSRPGFDCASVARALGGGGHAQAAGFIGGARLGS